MVQAMCQPDGGQFLFGALQRVVGAGEFQRHRDVLQGRHGRDEVKGLKDDADMLAAEARERVLVELLQLLSGDDDGAGVWPLQSGHHHQQRGFARAGRAEEADRLATAYIEVDLSQDMDAGSAAAERQVDAGKRDGVASGRIARNVVHIAG